jgi:hypothetical protein
MRIGPKKALHSNMAIICRGKVQPQMYRNVEKYVGHKNSIQTRSSIRPIRIQNRTERDHTEIAALCKQLLNM